ncbi:hypothetical protein [Yeosuana sp.]|uniref:hypothetical protein n=1 Tax=Yeosuana sp. TaxID=2529388 RepID=UPI0040550D04|tara:strand:- start:393 stop:674 length:282 start_codon:yes stop_codon:yes gene_type:complete
MENPLGKQTDIIFDDFHVRNMSEKEKEDYEKQIVKARVLLDNFRKENPDIFATYRFDLVNNQFSLFDKVGRLQTEENICQSFLIRLNTEAVFQ